MKKVKTVVRIGQGLMLLNAAIWLLVAIAYFAQIGSVPDSIRSIAIATGIGMLIYGGILLFLGIKLGEQQKIYFISSALLLGASVALTFLDRVGAADLIALIPPVFTLIFLLVNRKLFYGTLSA